MRTEKYYFTMGTDNTMPFIGGWVEVLVPFGSDSEDLARKVYDARFGKSVNGYSNFAFCYSEEQFQQTRMYKTGSNLGASCHAVFKFEPIEVSKIDDDVLTSRINLLNEADKYLRKTVSDEDIFVSTWLRLGVPDAATSDDLLSIAEDDQSYLETLELFAKVKMRDDNIHI